MSMPEVVLPIVRPHYEVLTVAGRFDQVTAQHGVKWDAVARARLVQRFSQWPRSAGPV